MVDWCEELIEMCKGGTAEDLIGDMAAREGISADKFASNDVTSDFEKPLNKTGSGSGFWEAPRGALYHSEKVTNGKIDGYQIIIPTTWNLAPINQNGEHGPIEQALMDGCPVFDRSEDDLEMPINALRLVHSYDPCVSCAVHVTDVRTGRHFSTVTNPWGVK
jgi:hydrogenase large subunit